MIAPRPKRPSEATARPITAPPLKATRSAAAWPLARAASEVRTFALVAAACRRSRRDRAEAAGDVGDAVFQPMANPSSAATTARKGRRTSVLALEEGHGALVDLAGEDLHRRRPGRLLGDRRVRDERDDQTDRADRDGEQREVVEHDVGGDDGKGIACKDNADNDFDHAPPMGGRSVGRACARFIARRCPRGARARRWRRIDEAGIETMASRSSRAESVQDEVGQVAHQAALVSGAMPRRRRGYSCEPTCCSTALEAVVAAGAALGAAAQRAHGDGHLIDSTSRSLAARKPGRRAGGCSAPAGSCRSAA
jgi:hypothetical protein